ncbi:hypothetical protein EJ02DRAFT_452897 [Clathrospora elynae]|uniref:GPI anchored protein n=1 Tax=Clathrospora elynae TaxID=706981 RepID=A0A6A5SVS7_9PLEO|nr:hypothetical protein EJ02DRAFT_452897 [Clathrospora elynae]
MRQSLAILAILASSAVAQDVVSFFFPGGYDGADPVATINTVNPSTTEFHIACPTSVDSTDCGWGSGLDYTIISQTRYQAVLSTESVSISLGCDYNSKAVEMTCTVNQSGGNDETGGPATAVLSGSDVVFRSATVVQGMGLLSGVASATGVAESTASLASSAAASATASASTGSKTAVGSAPATSRASGSGAMPTPSGSAAVKYGIEGSALLALAGAAALNMW